MADKQGMSFGTGATTYGISRRGVIADAAGLRGAITGWATANRHELELRAVLDPEFADLIAATGITPANGALIDKEDEDYLLRMAENDVARCWAHIAQLRLRLLRAADALGVKTPRLCDLHEGSPTLFPYVRREIRALRHAARAPAGAGIQISEPAAATRPIPSYVPTELESEILGVLKNGCFSAQGLADEMGRKHGNQFSRKNGPLARLRAAGLVGHHRRIGYYSTEFPPAKHANFLKTLQQPE